MGTAQILQEAEALKLTVLETNKGSTEAWVSRQALQDLYQQLLVLDLEFALDKKVEQDLWNHAFKNQINQMQGQTKEKQNPKRSEAQASLNLFLETASGFYLQFLQEICSAFKLDLPFRRKSRAVGILKEYGPVQKKLHTPKKSSCMYICQHCLVHLGDIARYRQQMEQAQTYYRHAVLLVPSNGQPYNQLAIVEAAKGNKLCTVFYYVRSTAVKHPFPVASTNLEKLFFKISKDKLDIRGKLSMSEILACFLQLQALAYLFLDIEQAKTHIDRLTTSLPTHITSMSFSSYQLLQMVTLSLFSLHHCKKMLNVKNKNKETESEENSQNGDNGEDTEQEYGDGGDSGQSPETKQKEDLIDKEAKQAYYDLMYQFLVSLLEIMVHHTPKQETKAKEYHTLPALKVLLDWLRTDSQLLSTPELRTNIKIWPSLSKLLNNLQFHTNQKDNICEPEKYHTVPLPEDCDLQCFTPIHKAHIDLDFCLATSECFPPELEVRVRCHRLIEHGLWLCDEFPSLNLMNIQRLRSGRLQFSAPTAHIKVLGGEDGKGSSDRKFYTQNVAIQAIMQKKAKKGGNQQNTLENGNQGARANKSQSSSVPAKSDAGVMAHTPRDGQDSLTPTPTSTPALSTTPSPASVPHRVAGQGDQFVNNGNMPQSAWNPRGHLNNNHLRTNEPRGILMNNQDVNRQILPQGSSNEGPSVLTGQGSPYNNTMSHPASHNAIVSQVSPSHHMVVTNTAASHLFPASNNKQQPVGVSGWPPAPQIGQMPPQVSPNVVRPRQTPIGSPPVGGSFSGKQQHPSPDQMQLAMAAAFLGSQYKSEMSSMSPQPRAPIPQPRGPIPQPRAPINEFSPISPPSGQQMPATSNLTPRQPRPQQTFMPKGPYPNISSQPIHSNRAPGEPISRYRNRDDGDILGQSPQGGSMYCRDRPGSDDVGNLPPASLHSPYPGPIMRRPNLVSSSPTSSPYIADPVMLHNADIYEGNARDQPGMNQNPYTTYNPLADSLAVLSQSSMNANAEKGGRVIQMPTQQGPSGMRGFQMQGIPKPDSPPTVLSDPRESLFLDEKDDKIHPSNTYSLFKQTPWAVPLNRRGVAESSEENALSFVGGTDRYSCDGLPETSMNKQAPGQVSPYRNQTTPTASGWNSPDIGPKPTTQKVSPSSMQGLWSSGPSPLERLLEQQKIQRQTDPH